MKNPGIIERIAIVGATLLLCLILFHFFYKKAQRKEDTIIREMQSIKLDSTDYWRDRYDREHAEKFMVEGTLDQIKTVWGTELKSKATELNVKEKHIRSLMMFNTEQGISLDSLIDRYVRVNIDTVRGVAGQPNRIIANLQYTPGLRISVKDSLGIANYVKKSGFLRYKKQNMIDIVSYNNSHISGIQSFNIKNSDPVVKFRPVISLIYTNKEFVPAIGIGAEFKILHIPILLSVSKGLQ